MKYFVYACFCVFFCVVYLMILNKFRCYSLRVSIFSSFKFKSKSSFFAYILRLPATVHILVLCQETSILLRVRAVVLCPAAVCVMLRYLEAQLLQCYTIPTQTNSNDIISIGFIDTKPFFSSIRSRVCSSQLPDMQGYLPNSQKPVRSQMPTSRNILQPDE